MFTTERKEFNSVKSFLDSGFKFQRVYYVPLDLKGKDWACCPAYPSTEELLNNFSEDVCEYQIHTEPDVIKKNLVIFTRKAMKPGVLFEEVK